MLWNWFQSITKLFQLCQTCSRAGFMFPTRCKTDTYHQYHRMHFSAPQKELLTLYTLQIHARRPKFLRCRIGSIKMISRFNTRQPTDVLIFVNSLIQSKIHSKPRFSHISGDLSTKFGCQKVNFKNSKAIAFPQRCW